MLFRFVSIGFAVFVIACKIVSLTNDFKVTLSEKVIRYGKNVSEVNKLIANPPASNDRNQSRYQPHMTASPGTKANKKSGKKNKKKFECNRASKKKKNIGSNSW